MKKIKRHSYIISTPGKQDAGAKHLQQVVYELERRGIRLTKDERALLIRRMRTTGTLILKDANRKTLAVVIKAHHTEVRKNPSRKSSPKMYRWYIPGGGDCLAPTHEDARRILGPYGSIYRKGNTKPKVKKNPSKSDRKLLTAAGAYRTAKGFQPHNRADVLAARVRLLQKVQGDAKKFAALKKRFKDADK